MPPPEADNPETARRLISIIVPCFNEAGNIADTVESILSALRPSEPAFEILVVNDGSADTTSDVIHRIAEQEASVRPIDLMRNFGQTVAYQTGLDLARGTHVILFSGDLEIPGNQIPEVIKALDAGSDFVNTSRRDRWGGSHALKSQLANRILNRISGLDISDRGSGLKGMRHEVARSLRLYGEWHRFLPDLASIQTQRITELEVPFEERKAGVSSYKGRLKSITVFLDLVTVAFTLLSKRKPYSLLPGRLFGFTGLLVGAAGFLISAWLVLLKLFFGEELSERPLFLVSILTTILGCVMVMVGALGELVMQIAARLERADTIRVRETLAEGKHTPEGNDER